MDAIAVSGLSTRDTTRDGSAAAVGRLALVGLGGFEKAGVKRWGENSEANDQAYADFMPKTGIIKQPATASELMTNDLIDEINRFDPEKIPAGARAYRTGG